MPTIGVAIAIPEPWATELQDYRTSVGDTTASMIPTHITLVPPTEVSPAELSLVEEHLEKVASQTEAFCIHLRGTGTFRPVSPVVFVTVAEGISSCEQLATAVRQGPLAVDLQFPYHPHVTIAHHLPDEALDRAFEELAGFESVFDADAFHLYVHDEEAGWQPTRDFPLLPLPEDS
jgi:2'-5' RNA ligase